MVGGDDANGWFLMSRESRQMVSFVMLSLRRSYLLLRAFLFIDQDGILMGWVTLYTRGGTPTLCRFCFCWKVNKCTMDG